MPRSIVVLELKTPRTPAKEKPVSRARMRRWARRLSDLFRYTEMQREAALRELEKTAPPAVH